MIVTEKHQITLEGHIISYTLNRSSRAKHIRLEVNPERGLTIVIPAAGNVDHARWLLKRKRRWVLEKLAKYCYIPSDPWTIPLTSGDIVPFLGHEMRIEILDCNGNTESVRIDQQNLLVSTTPENILLHLILEKWYRAEAQKKIRQIVDEQCRRMGLSYNRITLKSQKSLWGSCSRKLNLNFNWRLIMAPEPVIEYVVIHELAHLREMNHSKRFWQIVGQFCTQWHEHRQWLRKHTAELNRTLRA